MCIILHITCDILILTEVFYDLYQYQFWRIKMEIDVLASKWDELCELKESYMFGDETINKKKFAELVKETYDTIIATRSDFENRCEGNDDFKRLCIDYARLGAVLSKYSYKIRAFEDESKNYIYSVTTLIAAQLANLITKPVFYEEDKDGLLYMPFALDEIDYKYDIKSGDFSEIEAFIDAGGYDME